MTDEQTTKKRLFLSNKDAHRVGVSSENNPYKLIFTEMGLCEVLPFVRDSQNLTFFGGERLTNYSMGTLFKSIVPADDVRAYDADMPPQQGESLDLGNWYPKK